MGKRISLVDFDEIFNEDNVITNPDSIESKEFADDGVFSERIFGSFNENEDDKDIDTFGWIDFGKYYIINPNMFHHVKKCIPNLVRIINYNKSIDQNGKEVVNEDEVGEDEFIGLVEFKRRFVDLLEKYADKSKCQKEYDHINKHMKHVFINKLPVFSHKLRPASLLPKNVLVITEINNYYNLIIQHNNEIKDGVVSDNIDILLYPILYNIQTYANTIMNMIINDYLKGKPGHLRKNIMGSRINFSARNVITPIIEKEIDEVSMPYKTFAELYKFQLINLISTVKGINYSQARKIWERGILGFNEEFYSYMEELVNKTKGGCTFLLNRNPTISIGSIMYLKIAEVKRDYTDVTLGISNNLLAAFSGDYDGDVLNIIPIFDNAMKKRFELLAPTNFVVDRNNGRFNSDYDLAKEQIIGIYNLNN
jgi:RNA polymerase Rpb1, domain 2